MFDQDHSAGRASIGAIAPHGDPRLVGHTPQHLVDAFLRDGATGLIRDAKGRALQADAVVALRDALTDAGIARGDTVVVRAANDLTGVSAIMAVWLSGCTLCPVDPSGGDDVLAMIAEESGASAIVEVDGTVRPIDAPRVAHTVPGQTLDPATGDDLGMIIFTSGSSGRPKGVLLSNTNIMTALRSITTFLDLRAEDRILCIPPMFLDYGVYQVLFAMFRRCQLMVGSGIKNPLAILDLITGFKPTVIPVIPALASGLTRILNTFGQTIEGVRLVSNTGGHLAPATTDSLRRAFPGVQVVPMYGLTESKRCLHLPPEWVDDKPGSVGGPMPGLDARVVVEGPDGLEEAPDNVEGELYVRGSSVMQGYHSETATGGARLVHGAYRDDVWLATGDLFVRDEDGCLYFRGRSKSLIKQRGYCLYPRDIEAVAEALPEVRSAICVGRREDDGDETAVLFVVASGDTDQDAIIDRVNAGLHRTLQPKITHFLDEWPPSPVGKVDLKALATIAEGL